ncbi:MAG: alpha/beta hydrolase, partial [Bacteroidales bacterium]|nr:alpha/beta hydrolase [Bacteroidales bacterium]
SMIEPINFIKQISPRPLLMINAENDDVVPPMLTKILYKNAKKPKQINWYPTKHHDIPVEGVFQDGFDWFQKYL